MFKVEQSITENERLQLEKLEEERAAGWKRIPRSAEHACKTNNWLKLHHKPMRRKPFKRITLFIDETAILFGADKGYSEYMTRIMMAQRKYHTRGGLITGLRELEKIAAARLQARGIQVHIMDKQGSEFPQLPAIVNKEEDNLW